MTQPRPTVLPLLAAVLPASVAVAQNRPAKTLDIYVIDMEGGNAVRWQARGQQGHDDLRPAAAKTLSRRLGGVGRLPQSLHRPHSGDKPIRKQAETAGLNGFGYLCRRSL
jgi:hypothetical protein